MRILLMERRPEGEALALLNDRALTDYRLVPETALRAEALQFPDPFQAEILTAFETRYGHR